ncbi:myb-like DNA-binding protein bas1 [Coemansia sp. RSA 1365]|nr:myb-like DNA-binding protein bas1 [Coemansia sp. RSA 1365]
MATTRASASRASLRTRTSDHTSRRGRSASNLSASTDTHHLPDNAKLDQAMYLHVGGTQNEERKHANAGYSAAANHNDKEFPNEADINSMDVAELRHAMVSLVRIHRATCSPSSTPSVQDAAISIHARSPPSPHTSSSFASVSSLATPHAGRDTTKPLHTLKRHRRDSGELASQRIGIDLLINASNISDQMESRIKKYASPSYQLPSPPAHGKRSMSPSQLSLTSSEDRWHTSSRLPPILQIARPRRAGSDSTAVASPPLQQPGSSLSSFTSLSSVASKTLQSMSAAVETSFRMGAVDMPSLEAYKISKVPACRGPGIAQPAGNVYPSSYPPPLSTARLQHSPLHHPSPPETQHSSPMGAAPLQESQIVRLPSEVTPSLGSAICASSRTGETIIYPNSSTHRSRHRPRSPTIRASQHLQTRQYHPYQMQQAPPQLSPTSPQAIYAHSQNYFAHHMSPQHCQNSVMLPAQPVLPLHTPQMVSMAMQVQGPSPQQHLAGVHLTGPASVPAGAMQHSSKPKFNYAFMDTKRPRGPSSRWTADEDELLKRAVKQFGEDRQWVKVAQQVPGRTNLQCRQRWLCNLKAQVEKERNAAAKQ